MYSWDRRSGRLPTDSQVWLPGPTFQLPLSDPLAYVPNYFWNGTRSRSCWPTRCCISDVPFPSTSSRTPMFSCPRFLYTGSELRWPPFGTIGELRPYHTACLNMGALSSCHSHATDIFHHPSAPHLSTARLCSVNIHISPRRLICIMNPIFRAIFGLSLTVHGEAFVLDVIWDSGDVAHVVVTTTLQALDCLWLEKMLHTHA